MKLLIISDQPEHLNVFQSLQPEINHEELYWQHIGNAEGILEKIHEKPAHAVLIYPVISGSWNEATLQTLANKFPLLPLILFCSKHYEELAINHIGIEAWDMLLIEELTGLQLIKALKINIKRVESIKILLNAKQDADEAKAYSSRFLSRMSHEIRTPMNGIIGMAEMLLDTNVTDKQRYFIQTIYESGTLLVALVNDLLDFAKIETGKIRIYNKPYNLYDSIRECISSVLKQALDKRIEPIYHMHNELPLIFIGDDLRLRQIVMNLLDNAIKFTRQGKVKLEAKRVVTNNSDELCISISDTGPGIKEELIPQLFKPYTQAPENISVDKKGVGLGLAICHHLAILMNGRITVNSEVGKGSVFSVFVPWSPAQSEVEIPLIGSFKNKKAAFVSADSSLDEMLHDYCLRLGMHFEKINADEEHPVFDESFRKYDLIITHLRPSVKMDLKLVDAVREKRSVPHILLKEREKSNEKVIVIRKDTVIQLKPVDCIEFSEIVEAVMANKADSLNTVERNYHFDERMAENHPLDILVAEDNAINQRIIMSILNRYGFQVKMVENGKEAIESLERRTYDVVLMDIQMPVMDGVTAVKLIREQFDDSRQPYVVALTADALQQSRAEYIALGMDEVLYKPVQTNALMKMLAACKRINRGN